ncbi:orcokinin peptides type A-like [Schistocerca piceifrons]|uniref:orcokinin peptides type A-like n=1 Tax=Schistocerca piceifrons TaxID=274613 RepID=UPI001F5F95D0|nr:orcokinin peptides type A-like [Schistocerca piceifrons]
MQTATLLVAALAAAAVALAGAVPAPQMVSSGFQQYRDEPNDVEEGLVRHLDNIGGGHLLRNLDGLGGGHLLRQTKSGLDSLSGATFGEQKRLDSLGGITFGSQKRNFDEIDRSGFNSFIKKNFDEIDRSGFDRFVKKNFDEIDRSGFSGFVKRNAPMLARHYDQGDH